MQRLELWCPLVCFGELSHRFLGRMAPLSIRWWCGSEILHPVEPVQLHRLLRVGQLLRSVRPVGLDAGCG